MDIWTAMQCFRPRLHPDALYMTRCCLVDSVRRDRARAYHRLANETKDLDPIHIDGRHWHVPCPPSSRGTSFGRQRRGHMRIRLQVLILAAVFVASVVAIESRHAWAGTIDAAALAAGPGLGSGSLSTVTTSQANNDDVQSAAGNAVTIQK